MATKGEKLLAVRAQLEERLKSIPAHPVAASEEEKIIRGYSCHPNGYEVSRLILAALNAILEDDDATPNHSSP